MTFGVHFLFALISDFLQNRCPPMHYIDRKYMIPETLNYIFLLVWCCFLVKDGHWGRSLQCDFLLIALVESISHDDLTNILINKEVSIF